MRLFILKPTNLTTTLLGNFIGENAEIIALIASRSRAIILSVHFYSENTTNNGWNRMALRQEHKSCIPLYFNGHLST